MLRTINVLIYIIKFPIEFIVFKIFFLMKYVLLLIKGFLFEIKIIEVGQDSSGFFFNGWRPIRVKEQIFVSLKF